MSTPKPPVIVRYRGPDHALDFHPPHPTQAPDIIEAFGVSVTELRAFMPWAHLNQTVEGQYTRLIDMQSAYWSGREYLFSMYDPKDDTLLGCIGLHRRTLSSEALEIGYWVRSDRAGQGICTRAAQCMVALCFEHFQCSRVQCGFNAANVGSARVNAKVGFREEARLQRFETPPTPEQIANGMRIVPEMVLNVLLPEDRSALPWYDEILRNLDVVPWTSPQLDG
ncbi:MAG: GNAT family N-acetyltransferase [Bradymonadia bacterium]